MGAGRVNRVPAQHCTIATRLTKQIFFRITPSLFSHLP